MSGLKPFIVTMGFVVSTPDPRLGIKSSGEIKMKLVGLRNDLFFIGLYIPIIVVHVN